MQKLLFLMTAILECKLALTKYMETKVVFSGAKRKKTIWEGSAEMLYKFGKRQLPSLGLPEMLMVWLAGVSGDSAVDSWRKSGQGTELWGQDITLLQDHSYKQKRCQLHQGYSDVCNVVM